jgi:hypothetical protein
MPKNMQLIQTDTAKLRGVNQLEAHDVRREKLLLCVPAGWDAYLSGEFSELHESLVELGWSKVVIGNDADADILDAMQRALVVILWEGYEFLERNAYALERQSACSPQRTRRIAFCDDVHSFTTARREQRLRVFEWADTILATYPSRLRVWYPEVPEEKVRWIPHAAASYFHHSLTFSPASDRVLLSGSRTWSYPFRQFCAEKLSPDVCEIVDHPGYPGYPGDRKTPVKYAPAALQRIGRENYAKLLRYYPAMLCCGSIFGYMVAKVFESMAAGCLTICERATLAEPLSALGFREGEHYVGTDLHTVIEDVPRVLSQFLKDSSRWHKMVRAAAGKVNSEHTTAVRAVQIHHLCTMTSPVER